MAQIIKLLPEHVANQIAAGEVIQRPASAVKELMENAVDAGATHIQLIIRDGGRALVQVIDNGSGMNDLDARLAFARHATSKIKDAEDLWAVTTMGFRGEAMASIAAVSQVEMRTKLKDEELGTFLEIEGSEVKRLEACACPDGTSISVKNLYFNVPARRNFLKSNSVETRHIMDEFQRIALAFPEISFGMLNNGQEVYRLPSGNFKQRIVGLFGSTWNQRLISVKEDTSVVNVTGFIGKPDTARKSRGEQFFFINNRFVKSSYLNHAIAAAFHDLIPSDTYPVYFIRFETDPKTIDINIHPTKTEVKFEDERSVYAILRSAIRRAIGAFSLSPTLNFETEQAFDIPLPGGREIKAPVIQVNPDYNPFSNPRPAPVQAIDQIRKLSQARWEDLAGPASTNFPEPKSISETFEKSNPSLLHGKYICTQTRSGMMLIDRVRALERITFEHLMSAISEHHRVPSQQLLFPIQKEFNASDFELVISLTEELRALGFDFALFGKRSIAINGVPADIQDLDISNVVDELLEQFKSSQQDIRLNRSEQLAKAIARQSARFAPSQISSEQMMAMIDKLFACSNPNYSPSGGTIISLMTLDEIATRFNS
jgi:DNA mismatch repair protein MutL